MSEDDADQPVSNMGPDAPGSDPTGLTGILAVMIAVSEIVTSAEQAGFSRAEALQFGHEYFITLVRESANRPDLGKP